MSNIYFKNIKIKNFMSYEEADIKLNKNGYVLVNGVNNNPVDNAKSNGCGKSTIFNAIVWAFTGETTSGAKDVANVFLTGETSSQISFNVGKDEYDIIRTKNPSNLKVFINGEDKSGKGIRDTEKLLAEYLPDITKSLLNSVIILGQGLPQKFTNNSPSGRKEVLEKLSKSDFMISDIKQRVDNRKKELDAKLRELEDSLLINTNTKQMLISEVDNLMLELKKMTVELEDELRDRIFKYEEEIQFNRNSYNKEIKDKEICEKEIESYQNNLNNIYADKEKLKQELELENIEELKSIVNEVFIDIKNKNAEIRKLDNVKDTCPTCGQKLPDVHKIDTTELKEEVNLLQEDYNTHKFNLDKSIDKNNTISLEFEDRYYDKLNQAKKDLDESKSKLKQIEKNIDLSNTAIHTNETSMAKIRYQLENIEKNKKTLQEEVDLKKTKLKEITKKESVIYNDIEKLQKNISVNKKMSTIISRDFRGYLLTNVIEFINTKCKEYSMDIFETDNFEFALDGNNITIKYDNKEYELLSGGEKQKIDVIMQLSIRDMLCSYLNFSSNILVLDEITDSLDIIGANKVFNLISSKLNDVEAVYIISHHEDFDIPMDDEIRIVKGEDRISRIV